MAASQGVPRSRQGAFDVCMPNRPLVQVGPAQQAIIFIILAVFIHHFIIYFLELLRFGLFLDIFLRTLFNTIFTTFICILTIYLIKPNKR